MTRTPDAAAAGTIAIGGDLNVARLGFGTMRLTGKGIWGPPDDHDESIRVLRRAVELGVTFIDTADSYGPYVAEELIHEALHPYPEGVVIATKAGLLRTGPDVWIPLGNPSYLRQEVEMSLRRLDVDRIDLMQLHRVDPDFPLADQIGVLVDMQAEGKIRHIGVSEVDVDQLKAAQQITQISSVQNLYNLANRSAEPVLNEAEAQGIAFIPWFPLAAGPLAASEGPLHQLAVDHDAPVPIGAGMVVEAFARDDADTRDVTGEPPGTESGRGSDRADRRTVRGDQRGRGRLITGRSQAHSLPSHQPGQLCARVDIELGEDVSHMGVDGVG